ncbi:MAG: F0F1 ATP synthase subunit beta, partial [Anaerohalosphaera sp.]|nr:F0F1 ATP synthase subunit beta [Anaerohalosphaera sp.]
MNKGRIVQVTGSVFDAEFAGESPAIYNAVTVKGNFAGGSDEMVGEVQQHLGEGRVRVIALGSTLGIRRGMEVIDEGKPVCVPVGTETLGRVFNLLGKPVDGKPELRNVETKPIHHSPPEFVDLSAKSEMFETGI